MTKIEREEFIAERLMSGWKLKSYGGKFVLVKTGAERAEQVMKILRECRASRVNRHDQIHIRCFFGLVVTKSDWQRAVATSRNGY